MLYSIKLAKTRLRGKLLSSLLTEPLTFSVSRKTIKLQAAKNCFLSRQHSEHWFNVLASQSSKQKSHVNYLCKNLCKNQSAIRTRSTLGTRGL